MKGDFSRFAYDPSKHYTAVFMQQGRISLDADWNENVNIYNHLNRLAIIDLVGPCGVPRLGGGFKINCKIISNKIDIVISPGHIYVDGIICELEKEMIYSKQPDYPSSPQLNMSPNEVYAVYLDVWQRHITYIEDPGIREIALGSPDTGTRLKTVWQVKVKKVIDNFDCNKDIQEWLPPAANGRLTTNVLDNYQGFENHLYRVEIHDTGDSGKATYKWSRDNGSVVLPIEDYVSNDRKKLRFTPPLQVMKFFAHDVVEILDDGDDLSGRPGTLARVLHIDETSHILTLDRDVFFDIERHPKVRRWDNNDNVHLAIPVVLGETINLENGILIEFSGDNFKTGDYWIFAARTATQDIEHLEKEAPLGIDHRYCKLAVIRMPADIEPIPAISQNKVSIEDCRRLFPPITGWKRVFGKRIIAKYTWDDLILPKKILQHLHEIADQVRHSAQVYEKWDFESMIGDGAGKTALFYGPPGTGKTFSAGAIATDLGLDLFYVDLSSVVSKYIGETEKNLKRLFSQAEMTDVVLFFDEADALFGKRSEVKDAHDRYANMETVYLLQLMEEHEGLTIIASNNKPYLNKTFLRRLRFVVEFRFPDAAHRRRIWENIFPSEIDVRELDYDALARFKITGGEIRNIALNATFLAVAKGMPVNMSHIKHALRRAREKMGLS
jgi:hypothetical protein